MLDLLVKLAIARRNLVMVVVAIVALLGLWNFNRLPIDAVPRHHQCAGDDQYRSAWLYSAGSRAAHYSIC